MKISQDTIAALKNFAGINPSLIIREGFTQKTVALPKNIVGSVTLTDNFPQEFGIYDLAEFLNVLSMMPDAEIEFGEKSMKITNDTMSTQFVYSDPSNIHPDVPEKELDEIMPDADLTFTLKKDDLVALMKMSSAMSLEDVVITSENGKLILRITDLSSDSSHHSDIVIGDAPDGVDFSFNYKMERFMLLPDDYEVNISSRLISYFVGKNNNAEYLISLEKSSHYE